MWLWRGSFPAMVAGPQTDRELFYGSYLQTYLQRDLRQLAQVGDELAFLRFLRATAARTGQLLNMADLARDAGVSHSTAGNWLSILQISSLVHLLQPWHSNVTKRLIKTPKLYFLDTGLCVCLTQWSSPQTLEAGAMSGPIFETWVLLELLKSYWHQGRDAPFNYFRNKDQREIDLLIAQDGQLFPMECKKTSTPGRDSYASFKNLAAQSGMPVGPGAVACMVAQNLPLADDVTAVAVAAW